MKGAGGTGDWELFNLKNDPAEMHDLSRKHPEKREAMLKLWDEYVKTNGVIVSEAGPFLKITVQVNGKIKYQGSTSEISHKAEDVFAWLGFIAPLKPGTVAGFGTIPDCTGCDHDDFIDPGAEIAITFERLGTLHCRFAEPEGKLSPSRWPVRESLQKHHR